MAWLWVSLPVALGAASQCLGLWGPCTLEPAASGGGWQLAVAPCLPDSEHWAPGSLAVSDCLHGVGRLAAALLGLKFRLTGTVLPPTVPPSTL